MSNDNPWIWDPIEHKYFIKKPGSIFEYHEGPSLKYKNGELLSYPEGNTVDLDRYSFLRKEAGMWFLYHVLLISTQLTTGIRTGE
jgi:hypothetical protein